VDRVLIRFRRRNIERDLRLNYLQQIVGRCKDEVMIGNAVEHASTIAFNLVVLETVERDGNLRDFRGAFGGALFDQVLRDRGQVVRVCVHVP
jgi:hypothetical protein